MNVYASFGEDYPVFFMELPGEDDDTDGCCDIPEELMQRYAACADAEMVAQRAILRHLVETGQWDEDWPEMEREWAAG